MNFNDLFEGRNGDEEKQYGDARTGEAPKPKVKTKRGARLTMYHLLKLRRMREKKKLQRLKDLELYYVMYGPADEGGDDMSF